MDLKAFRSQILYGSIARRVLLRILAVSAALAIVPLLHIYSRGNALLFSPIGAYDCAGSIPRLRGDRLPGMALFRDSVLVPIWGSFESAYCEEYANLSKTVVWELMAMELLDYSAKTLCAGGGSGACVVALRQLGFPHVSESHRNPFFSPKRNHFVYELDYEDNSFNFVLSRYIDKVTVPALLVLEMERVLKPSGLGAVLVGLPGSDKSSLIRSASPVSSLLKASTVVHAGFMNDLALIVFQKKFQSVGFFGQFALPADCPTIANNRPVIDFMEPLVQKKEKPVESEQKIAYLPNLIDVSSRKRLVYIDIGAGEHMNMNSDHSNWFLPSYPVDIKSFIVYFVDHNTSVLRLYVKKPGVAFVYHPGLSGNKEILHNAGSNHDSDLFPDYEGFDFLAWFIETVRYADFVVLKMNSGEAELKFLRDMFESGAICFVDEMFLHCSEPRNSTSTMEGDCIDIFRGLRSVGVFVHQWWGK